MPPYKGGFPPLPSWAFSHLGPIPVLRKKLAKVFGRTRLFPRTITVVPNQCDTQAWQTYWHECIHVALWDAGVKLPDGIEENLCDVLGTYFAAAVRAGFLKVTNEDHEVSPRRKRPAVHRRAARNRNRRSVVPPEPQR